MAEHRTSRLKIYGDGVEVEKLINSRYRVIVRCMPQNKLEDWYYTNIGNTFAEFATEMDDEIKVDGVAKGWQGVTAMPYSNAKLIAMEMGYTQTGDYVVTFIYETLTASWVSSEADVVGATENGLRTLTKTQVAAPGTTVPYDEDDVGVETITNGGKTLYLAGLDDVSDERMSRFITKWAEAGILSKDITFESPGVMRVTITFLAVEGVTVGPIVSRRTGNYDGLKTISVTTIQDKNGDSIVKGGDNLVNTIPIFTSFTYPGVATLKSNVLEDYSLKHDFQLVEAPAECKVRANVYIVFSSTAAISTSYEVYQSAEGLWSPNNWCTISVDALSYPNNETINTTQTLRGYRSSSSSVDGTINKVALSGVYYFYNGSRISDTTSIEYDVTIDKGPPDPIGKKWVLDIDSTLAFEDLDGVPYYKKTIVVTDTIPAQVSGKVPYSGPPPSP